jgi:signal transduction histidine kinase
MTRDASRSGTLGGQGCGCQDRTSGDACLAELYRVSKAVLSVTQQRCTRDVLQVIVTSARSLAGARYAALGVPDDRGSFADFVVDGLSESEQRAIGPLPRQHGMLGVLLRDGEPVRLADIRADPRFEGWPAAHPEVTGFLGVPIKQGDSVLGIIFVANKTGPHGTAEPTAHGTAEHTSDGTAEPAVPAAGRTGAAGFTERDQELLALFAAHAAIALTNARLYERSRELSVLEERSRLARELHDAVSQKLFGIRTRSRAAALLATRDADRAAAEMAVVAALGAEAHAELRAVIDGLAPPDLRSAGLAESLRRYTVLASRAHGVPVRFAADGIPGLGERVDAALYRVAQEALHNALRHSGAGQVSVTLRRGPRRVILEVADDGRGLPSGTSAGGLGLASMRERTAAVGGSLTIRSAARAGTLVRMVVPAAPQARGAGVG